jgi:hypothetical protein
MDKDRKIEASHHSNPSCPHRSIETEFKHGRYLEGHQAEIKWPDGSFFGGFIDEDGLPKGHGTVRYANGDCYEGAMRDGKRHGKGSTVFSNGECFVGFWTNDEMGKGKLTLASGIVHDFD